MSDDNQSLVSDGGVANARATAELLVRQAQRIGQDHAGRYAARLAQWPLAAAQAALAGVTSDAWPAYTTDAMQRGLIMLDVLRRRGNTFLQHEASGMPPVLDFAFETVIDGHTLPRPVNYSLLVITPPTGVTIDPDRRPFMIVDPRAGHGAGIGGFKPESQVGDAFHDGHAVYFVVFRPRPEPGQTLADVRDAEEAFLDEIARRHPKAEKPVIIGNCQGGWGCMLLAATAPDKVGPVAINGAPMSYWAGRTGRHPMRYTGGLVGGVTPALIMADLGHGLFDGSLLVQNFEYLNPANTWWKKLYNLYAGVDTETERFLEFERWWSGFFMMNKEEIRWIVENLFIGNRLSHGQASLGDDRVDLRKIGSPIIVFASHGDNITPPQQALNWIADLYRDVNEIKAHGQRIVYLLHESIGHLGIFVSAKIAGREHEAITETMRAIEALPPGLYEMVLEQAPDRLHIKFAPRGVDDLLALDDGRDDEAMFAAVAKLSELGAHTYETLVGPTVRALATAQSAQLMFDTRPLRVERAAFSDRNPAMRAVEGLAAGAREQRKPVAADNPFLRMQQLAADHIEQSWDLFRDMRDVMLEASFQMIYGSPWMRLIGADGLETRAQVSADNLLSLPNVRAALANIEHGGEAEATVRMLELVSNARGYLRRSRLERETKLFHDEEPWRSMDETHRARLIHEQSLIVQFAPDQAKSSLLRLLDTAAKRARALDLVMRIAGPAETMHPRALAMYKELESMLGRHAPPAGEAADDAATGDAHWPEQRSA
jgi:pimeloyl-ACP methyl ester carboxylesterase